MTMDDRERPSLVDTHAHLEDSRLRGDLAGVLDRARAVGVVQIVAIGTTAEDSAVVAAMAGVHGGIFATVGVHPNHAAEAKPGDWECVAALAGHPRIVGLGETGLDLYRDHTPLSIQQEWFDRHLALGHERGLPVVIHCRNSEREIHDQLARSNRLTHGVLHSFTGTWDDARAFLDLGLYLSFAGMLTFANKALDALRDVASRVPLERVLVETDSPYLSPHPHRGETNEPRRVAVTAECLARVRGLPLAEVAAITTENARRLFRLPADNTL
jgi:TatD DNase family protein